MFADGERPSIVHIWPAIETTHESAGTLLARIWELPDGMHQCIGQHHNFQGNGIDNKRVATLHVAEAIAARLGRGVTPHGQPQFLRSTIDNTPPEVVSAAQAMLELNQTRLLKIVREASERLDTIR